MRSRAIIPLALILCSIAWADGPKIEKGQVDSQGRKRTYYVYVPATVAKPAPLLLLLHGSGHDGRLLVEKWQKLAEAEGIILVGPDAWTSSAWNSKNDTPVLMRNVIEAVAAKYPVDPHRMYVFGHSAGASYGLVMALVESQYFAAVAVHAGALREQEYRLTQYAGRKVPIAIWSGTLDRSIPIGAVRATAEELKRREFPLSLHEMPGHDHNYYFVSDEVNAAVWEFLKRNRIEEPSFTEYDY